MTRREKAKKRIKASNTGRDPWSAAREKFGPYRPDEVRMYSVGPDSEVEVKSYEFHRCVDGAPGAFISVPEGDLPPEMLEYIDRGGLWEVVRVWEDGVELIELRPVEDETPTASDCSA